MDAMFPLKTGPTQARWQAAMRDKAFDLIRSRRLMETASEHFLQVLNAGTISTNIFMRRLHNFAAFPLSLSLRFDWHKCVRRFRGLRCFSLAARCCLAKNKAQRAYCR
jgi:hypothetical protein